MNTNDFLAKLDTAKGLAPTNRFIAIISGPSGLAQPADLSFFCDQAPLGARTIATSDLKHYGPVRKIARENTYAEYTLRFIMTNACEARDYFVKWMDMAVSPETANMKYYDEYKGDVDVLAFDQTNESVSVDRATTGTKYIDTFPTSIEAITMAWDNTNQLGQFNVSFVCRKWQAI